MATLLDAFRQNEEDAQKLLKTIERRKVILEYLWNHYLSYLQDESFPEIIDIRISTSYNGLTLRFNISDKRDMRPILQYMKTLSIFKIQRPDAGSKSYDVNYWIECDAIQKISEILEINFYYDSFWIKLEFYPEKDAICLLKKIGTKRISYEQSIYSLECAGE